MTGPPGAPGGYAKRRWPAKSCPDPCRPPAAVGDCPAKPGRHLAGKASTVRPIPVGYPAPVSGARRAPPTTAAPASTQVRRPDGAPGRCPRFPEHGSPNTQGVWGVKKDERRWPAREAPSWLESGHRRRLRPGLWRPVQRVRRVAPVHYFAEKPAGGRLFGAALSSPKPLEFPAACSVLGTTSRPVIRHADTAKGLPQPNFAGKRIPWHFVSPSDNQRG